jgi:Flp pilus assembly protein TadD
MAGVRRVLGNTIQSCNSSISFNWDQISEKFILIVPVAAPVCVSLPPVNRILPVKWPLACAAASLVAAIGAAYSGSFAGPFVFDDGPAIVGNGSIKHWSSVGAILSPPLRTTVAGRPLVNLSLAINYAAGRLNPWGYHAANLAIHLAAALTLFGLLRRLLQRTGKLWRHPNDLTWVAMVIALLWALHPLQTESVSYVIQRAESLMGLFFLLTLYCFERSVTPGVERVAPDAPAPTAFRPAFLSVAACVAGMLTKEVMAVAPLVVWCYDRTFVAGSFAEALRRRRAYYLALALSWLPLAFLVLSGQARSGSAGFSGGEPWWQYGRVQLLALCHYLRLVVWPSPLVFDYGPLASVSTAGWMAAGLATALLLLATLWGLARRAALGFAGAWFFLILAPSSSVMPITTEAIAEHRMYLPLAAPLALAVLALYRCNRFALALPALACIALGWSTAARNRVYRTPIALWTDTVNHRPGNPRAQDELGNALAQSGQLRAALPHYAEAVRLAPQDARLRNNFGSALAAAGRGHESSEQFRAALRLLPVYPEAHYNLGGVLLDQGDPKRAAAQFAQALAERPDYAEAEANLAVALAQAGDATGAVPHFRRAAVLNAADPENFVNLGMALAERGEFAEAAECFHRALQLRPGDAATRRRLELLTLRSGLTR